MRQGLGAGAHQARAAPQEVSRGAHGRRIDVSHGKHAAAQKKCYLLGVDLVGLGLAAVDRFHIQGVAQHEGDLVFGAQIGQPVPGEHALDADDDPPPAIGRQGVEKVVPPCRQIAMDEHLASLVEDADVHGLGVQIDPAVEWMLLLIEPHHGPPECWETVEPEAGPAHQTPWASSPTQL